MNFFKKCLHYCIYWLTCYCARDCSTLDLYVTYSTEGPFRNLLSVFFPVFDGLF